MHVSLSTSMKQLDFIEILRDSIPSCCKVKQERVAVLSLRSLGSLITRIVSQTRSSSKPLSAWTEAMEENIENIKQW